MYTALLLTQFNKCQILVPRGVMNMHDGMHVQINYLLSLIYLVIRVSNADTLRRNKIEIAD